MGKCDISFVKLKFGSLGDRLMKWILPSRRRVAFNK